ncbi:MAG: inositol phosphorylceramide synthase, partial [Chitinophagaceae bacterium]|nr:inositol phosphorylceramide synthase [Chitinophagaceae bacterium]
MEPALIENKSLYNRKSIITMLLISLGYLLVSWILIGFRPEQLFLLAIINLFYFLSSITRKFILGFSVFVVYWVVFDYMKAFPNYEYNTVHIESLYQLEKSLFGFSFQNKIITPNEYWLIKHSTALDITTGFFYLSWVPVPLAFAGYL